MYLINQESILKGEVYRIYFWSRDDVAMVTWLDIYVIHWLAISYSFCGNKQLSVLPEWGTLVPVGSLVFPGLARNTYSCLQCRERRPVEGGKGHLSDLPQRHLLAVRVTRINKLGGTAGRLTVGSVFVRPSVRVNGGVDCGKLSVGAPCLSSLGSKVEAKQRLLSLKGGRGGGCRRCRVGDTDYLGYIWKCPSHTRHDKSPTTSCPSRLKYKDRDSADVSNCVLWCDIYLCLTGKSALRGLSFSCPRFYSKEAVCGQARTLKFKIIIILYSAQFIIVEQSGLLTVISPATWNNTRPLRNQESGINLSSHWSTSPHFPSPGTNSKAGM